MIKRFIYKTNEWYLKLPEIKGGFIYLGLILIPYSFLVIFANAIWGMSWILMLALWRSSYSWLKVWDEHKIQRKREKNNFS